MNVMAPRTIAINVLRTSPMSGTSTEVNTSWMAAMMRSSLVDHRR